MPHNLAHSVTDVINVSNWNALTSRDTRLYNTLICSAITSFTSAMIESSAAQYLEFSVDYCNHKFQESNLGPTSHLLSVKSTIKYQSMQKITLPHLFHFVIFPAVSLWYSLTRAWREEWKSVFTNHQALKVVTISSQLTVVVIICSWHVFRRETVSCVANNKRRFSDSTISNEHTLDVDTICRAVSAALHWRLPQSDWVQWNLRWRWHEPSLPCCRSRI